MQKPLEVWVPSLCQDDPLEEEMATHSILAWKILWTEEPGGLQSVESQRQIPEATKHGHETSLLETAQQFLNKRSDFIFQQQCMRGSLALRSQQT